VHLHDRQPDRRDRVAERAFPGEKEPAPWLPDFRGFAESVLLWNLVPTHPHRPGRPDSNRPPTRAEIAAGRPFLEELARGRKVVPVGRLAQEVLGGPYVRHPSHGGAGAFRDGLGTAFRSAH